MKNPVAIGAQGNALGSGLLNGPFEAAIRQQPIDLFSRLIPYHMVKVYDRGMRKTTKRTGLRLLERNPNIASDSLVA